MMSTLEYRSLFAVHLLASMYEINVHRSETLTKEIRLSLITTDGRRTESARMHRCDQNPRVAKTTTNDKETNVSVLTLQLIEIDQTIESAHWLQQLE